MKLTKKGEVVKTYSVVSIALLCLCGMAVSAHAQEEGTVVANVPFDFIAGGKTLPAGKYTVRRTSFDTTSALIITDRKHSAFLLAANFDDAAADNFKISFEHVGDTYLLSKVATPIGTYTIDTGRELSTLTRLAQTKTHTGSMGMTSSGTP